MKKRLLSLTLIAALCLSLFPTGAAPALAVDGDTVYVGGVALTSTNNATVYATTDDSGNVSQDSATADDYNIKWDGSTLTLDGAKIKGGTSSGSLGATVGIYAFNNSGGVSLNIALKGVNEIFESSNGIWVYSSFTNAGNATLAIEGEGSLNASGSSSGILVQSNSGDATLTIQDADVTAENSSSSGDGVTVRAGESSNASLAVEGGSLTATDIGTNGVGIRYTFGSSSSGSGKPSLTVSDSAIVKANGNGGEGGITSNSSPVTPSGTGIVFNNGTGTVYGNVTLQEDLTIESGQTLTLAENASLSPGGHNVIVDGGTLGEGLAEDLDESVKYTPTITTESLADGRVGEPYSASLGADGTAPITWSIAEDSSLPTNLTLNESTGEISGTPTTAETSTFTVKATNGYGNGDSKKLSITINQAQDTTPPTLTAGSTTRTGEANAIVTFTSNEAGSYYYTVVEGGATEGTDVGTSGSGDICNSGTNTINLDNLTGTTAKDIYIVVKDAANNVSQPLKMEIPAYVAPSYSISATPAALNFGSIDDDQAAPAAQNVTITNTGNRNVTVNLPTSTNYTITAGTGFTNGTVMLAPNATATFTVQPKAGLSAGTYNETLTISGDNDASAEIVLTFTVNERPYTGKYSYEIVSDVGENGTIDVERYATEGDQVTLTVSPDEAYLLDDLTVTSGGKDVALTDNGDGTYTFTMPSGDVAITATFVEDPNWEEPEDPATDVSEIFTDVPANHWAKAAIQYAYDNGLMTGVSDTAFAPEATTTRAMIVSMLARMENVTSAADAGFADVAASDWYATAVNWAAANGIVSGISDDTFAPNDPITREQLAAMLMNVAQWKGQDISARADLSDYTDAPSTWASEAVQWAVAEGLLAGVTDDQLQPQGQATRAQVAAIMQRFLEA